MTYTLLFMFNRVDEDRVKEVGPDRACAEWLLKNGGFVKWKDVPELLTDYNALPKNGQQYYIEGVDANNAGICDVGFEHFKGCKYVKDIKLENCKYVDNNALPYLSILKDSLNNLEIISCANISDEGLLSLKVLKNLESLKLQGLIYVKKKDFVNRELSEALPNCKIDFQ
nr:PREDICTED: ATP synthase subunit s, mitochondrial isoform X2 [Megachile rotundata]